MGIFANRGAGCRGRDPSKPLGETVGVGNCTSKKEQGKKHEKRLARNQDWGHSQTMQATKSKKEKVQFNCCPRAIKAFGFRQIIKMEDGNFWKTAKCPCCGRLKKLEKWDRK